MDDVQLPHWDPWRNLNRLPSTAPIRAFRPHDYPKPEVVEARLRQEGIDPESAGAIITAIVRRGWLFRLIGGTFGLEQPRFTAEIIEPRYAVPWAHGTAQPTPAMALGQLYVTCLDHPPWEQEERQTRRP